MPRVPNCPQSLQDAFWAGFTPRLCKWSIRAYNRLLRNPRARNRYRVLSLRLRARACVCARARYMVWGLYGVGYSEYEYM